MLFTSKRQTIEHRIFEQSKTKSPKILSHVGALNFISVQFQYRQECFLRDLYVTNLAHPFLTFLLFFQEFTFPRNIPTVAFGQYVFPESRYCIADNDLLPASRLNGNFKHLAR